MTIEAGRQGARAPFRTFQNLIGGRFAGASNRRCPERSMRQTWPTILDIGEAAAGNLIGPLRAVGLIDENGRPTDRALAWRDDDQYRQITTDMLEQVYPQGLRDAAPPPNPDRGAVVRWFSRSTGAGQAATERTGSILISCWPRVIRQAPINRPASAPHAMDNRAHKLDPPARDKRLAARLPLAEAMRHRGRRTRPRADPHAPAVTAAIGAHRHSGPHRPGCHR